MNDPQKWRAEWGWTVGERGRLGRGGQRGKNRDNCNRIMLKYKLEGALNSCQNSNRMIFVKAKFTSTLYIYVYIYIYIHIHYIYIYIHRYIHTYTYIHIHTYTEVGKS